MDFAKNTFNQEIYNGNPRIETWRISFWVHGEHQIIPNKLKLRYESYIQPSLENSDNFRWQIDAGLDAKLWKGFFFRLNHLYAYEGVVAEGQQNEDRLMTFGIGLKF